MITDSVLLQFIRDDDEKAFSQLFYRYNRLIYLKAHSYIRDEEVCEQIVHDIFLSLWTNRKTVQINAVKGYLTAAARYQVYKHIAATKIIPIDYKADVEELSSRTVSNTGYERLTTTDLDTELHSSLDNLPKRCREIFLMSRKQTLSNEEIAGRLGISKRSVENQITFALKHLRGALKHISVVVMLLMGW